MKLRLVLAYDGSRFLGLATQPHQNSVQDRLFEALKHLGITQRPLFASRTDKGVHSLANVASVECGEHFSDLEYLRARINHHAKPFIYVRELTKMSKSWQVRFDVKRREYRYIFNHSSFSPLLSGYYHFCPKFDIKLANEALKLFVGKQDLKFF